MNDRTPLPESITCRADVDALLAAATNYEEKRPRDPLKKALDLDRVRALLESVGNPQEGPRTVHIAGSKGKGTVARMIASGLRHAGRGPVGLYTSPHLEDLSERIEIDGEPVAEGPLARAGDAVLPHVRRSRGTPDAPTFFEIFTAMAWVVFREAGCTDVVLETGLGGRLDATNVCSPAVTVITKIELEHTAWLGETIEEIAAEKAGIIKPGVPVVCYELPPAAVPIVRRAHAVDAHYCGTTGVAMGGVGILVMANVGDEPVVAFSESDFPGGHFPQNVGAAYAALRILGVDDELAWKGIALTRLPGILEVVGDEPPVVVDGAHTQASAEGTRAAVAGRWPGKAVTLLFAMLGEKNVAGVASALTHGVAHVVTTRVDSPRSMTADALADVVRGVWDGEVEAIDDLGDALARARELAGDGGLVLCTGSVYLAGAVKTLLRGQS